MLKNMQHFYQVFQQVTLQTKKNVKIEIIIWDKHQSVDGAYLEFIMT